MQAEKTMMRGLKGILKKFLRDHITILDGKRI